MNYLIIEIKKKPANKLPVNKNKMKNLKQKMKTKIRKYYTNQWL